MSLQLTVVTSIGTLCGLALGCGSQSNSVDFEFELLIELPDEVTDTAIDDPMAIFEVVPGNGSSRILEVHRFYPTYETGSMASPLNFSFSTSDGSVTMSTAQVGACETVCIYPHCPEPSTIAVETLQISTIDFAPFDFTCMECEGGGKRALACE